MSYVIEYTQNGHDHVQFTDEQDLDRALTEISAEGGTRIVVEGY